MLTRIGVVVSLVAAIGALPAVVTYVWWTTTRTQSEQQAVELASAITPSFSLVSHRGERVSGEDYGGKWLLMFFGFTHCPDVCPTTLAELAAVMQRLGSNADAVQPLFVSIDPGRDTVDEMAEYVTQFHPSIVGLTGTDEEIAAATENFRVFYERTPDAAAPDGYTMSHTSAVYLVSPEGEFVVPYTYGTSVEEIVDDLTQRIR